jgi:glyoxylase-like metal-dependent hydrolase (beta-lactamase superfamily II)
VTPTPDIVTLSLPTPYMVGRVNCYLLLGTPLTLIDPGPSYGDARDALLKGLAEHGVSPADVELVLLTHQHTDHEGHAGLVREASGCAVAAHRDLVGYLRDMPSSLRREDDYQAEMMRLHGVPDEIVDTLHAVSQGFHRFGASVEVDRPLADGDAVEAGGRRLTALHRPGHSPSDTLFVDEEHRLAFAGDHLLGHISSNPVAHRPLTGPADPRHRPPTLPTYLDSLRQTAALELDLVHPGHGAPIPDHAPLIESRLAKQQERTTRVSAALVDGPCTAHAIARTMWGDVATRQAYLTLSEVLGALDVLLAEGAVEELGGGDGELLTYGLATG